MPMEQNIELNNLIFRALYHGVDSIRAGGNLIPFVITEKNLQRFVSETLEDSKNKAEEHLLTLKDEHRVALVYDGFFTVGGIKYDAVFVKGFDRNDEKGILFAQRYKQKKLLSKFEVIGNPAIVGYPLNPLYKKQKED